MLELRSPKGEKFISRCVQLLHTFVVDVLTYRCLIFLSFSMLYPISIMAVFERSHFSLNASVLSAIPYTHCTQGARCAVKNECCVMNAEEVGPKTQE